MTGIESGLVVDITALGEVEAGRAVRRDTGRAGDIVWATGAPGSSAAGLALLQAGIGGDPDPALLRLVRAYLEPAGRIREGRALGRSGAATSMIDLSDGLIGDLRHLVEGTDRGIVLEEESLPIGEELLAAGVWLGRPPDSFLFSASDDYELLFTTAPKDGEQALAALRQVPDLPLRKIGEVVGGGGGEVVIEDRHGRRRPPGGSGWDHFLSGPKM